MRLFRTSLTLQMAVATLLGVFCGLFFGDLCQGLSPYGTAYIMLLKVTAVPYLICAIIHGVGQLSLNQAKVILKNGVLFISMAWIINILIIYLIKAVFPTPKSTQLGGYIASDHPPLNFAELLIPDNIFYDLSSNTVPAIVIFSLLIGIALMQLKNKETLMNGFQNIVEALTRITSWIARITPIGTFLIIANQVGTIQFSTIKQVSTYIILYIAGTGLVIFWIYPRLVNMLTSIASYRWLQQLLPILLLAYTTNVVIVCLPYIIELLRKETQILDPLDEKAQSQIQGTVSVVFNLPLGSLFLVVFVFFISIFYNFPLSLSSQFELFLTTFLTSLGAVGLGSWINSLTFILDSLGLPYDAVNIYLTTLPFTSGFQSMVSVMAIATISLLITLSCRNMLKFRWLPFIRKTVLTIVPILLLFYGIKWLNFLPEIRNEIKSIYELTITSSILAETEKEVSPEEFTGDTFDHILETKVLRVGYQPSATPFSFTNADGSVVGYDIAFAYELAYDLGCKLELIPLNYSHLIEELNEKKYDIAMSAISITEHRLKYLSFSKSYLTPRFVFVVKEQKKKQFQHLEDVLSNPFIEIAVLKGSSYEHTVRELFPHHKIITLSQYDDFLQQPDRVALFWEEAEAAAWTICHRKYRVILPQPSLGKDTLGYAIRNDSARFLHYLNEWLDLKKTQGYTDKQYDLWVKGKTEIAAPPEKRWSIVRDVFHWVE